MPWEPWRRPDEKRTGQSGGKSERSAFEQNCGIYMGFMDGFIWIYMDLDLDLHGLI
jgi:hypothetical protein